ncbi:MAG: flavin-containing monooxygenase [Pirellulales bacterium]
MTIPEATTEAVVDQTVDRSQSYCIVGAGSSGLAMAKQFADQGIAFDVLEREDEVGGNWYFGTRGSAVYASTHLISSKRMTEFKDFPMPDSLPDYPNHRQVCQYLRSYARHFDLYPRIEFHTTVERIEPAGDSWDVRLADGQRRTYAGVVIGNGHNWDPKYPDFPGEFTGTTLHAASYKSPDVLRGRRVLVVGAGNSGCDIAVESAQNAAATFHSVRRGYHYMPKYFMGMPADVLGENMLRWHAPLWLRRATASILAKLILGWPQDYGLRKPDHRLFETHPIVNSQMLYYVGHGDITVKPDVQQLVGDRVRFVDGSEEQIDVIVYATGYKISFPFIDREHLAWKDGRPDFFLNVFHPRRDNLFVVGLIQPDSGQFGLVEWQARLIARFVAAQQRRPDLAERFRRIKSVGHVDTGKIKYLNSSRHLLEVEHYSYRKRLQKLAAMFA